MIKIAQIKSLHLHSEKKGGPMVEVEEIELIAGTDGVGIKNAPRKGQYDHRPPRMKSEEDPNWRHLSIMHRLEAREHERAVKEKFGSIAKNFKIKPGDYQANVELDGLFSPEELKKLLGRNLKYHDPSNDRDYLYQSDDEEKEVDGAIIIISPDILGKDISGKNMENCPQIILKILRFPCNLVRKKIPLPPEIKDLEDQKFLINRMDNGNQGIHTMCIKNGKIKPGYFFYLSNESAIKFKLYLPSLLPTTIVPPDGHSLTITHHEKEEKKKGKSAAIVDD